MAASNNNQHAAPLAGAIAICPTGTACRCLEGSTALRQPASQPAAYTHPNQLQRVDQRACDEAADACGAERGEGHAGGVQRLVPDTIIGIFGMYLVFLVFVL